MRERLAAALKLSRADYAEIRAERSWSTSVGYRGRRLEAATASEDLGGFVRVLHHGCGWGTASFTSLDQLEPMLARAGELSRAVRLDQPIRLADVPPHEAEVLADLDGDVRGVSLAEKQRLLEAYNGEMLAVDGRVVDTQASYADDITDYWYVNSQGTSLHELRTEVVLSGTAIARTDGVIEKGLESIGLRRGWKSVQGKGAGFAEAARRAVALLDAPTVKGGTYPVILDPEMAGVFIHEAFGHLSEADFVYENPEARAMMTIGRRFGKPVLNVGDNGAAPGLRGTLPFDDEGTPTQDSVLIKDGILVGRLHSRETAAAMGERPTGNARAISFRHAPIVRMTNTYIAPGRGTFEDLIRDVKLGVYAVSAFGGQTLLENFSFTAAYGRMIRDGRLAEMVKNVVLAGNLFQTLDRIDHIAGDFQWNQMGGGCGKGGQFPLPVTEGAPHLRIEEALVGGDVG
ncbi:MAG TPA: TldD/PmbA family protein [Gemmatimonadales bacterium]|nr:TldD/PmbA family protein [Gemmatimonadales bacterium]